MGHFFSKTLVMKCFSRPKRPYEGQLNDLLAFVKNFYENSKRPIKKLPVFEKKSSKKFVPRPAAFILTLSFMVNFL